MQNKQKLFLYNLNAHVREWIMLEKVSLNSPILDGLGVQGGVETWKSWIALFTKDDKEICVSEGSLCAIAELEVSFLCEVGLGFCDWTTDGEMYSYLICKNRGMIR